MDTKPEALLEILLLIALLFGAIDRVEVHVFFYAEPPTAEEPTPQGADPPYVLEEPY